MHKDWAYENGLLYGIGEFTIMFLVKNFIKEWGTFAKIVYSSKISEIVLTISKVVFFTQFIKIV